MCREYAENELLRQWTAEIILILLSWVYLSPVSILFFCYHILWWKKLCNTKQARTGGYYWSSHSVSVTDRLTDWASIADEIKLAE